MAVLRTTGIAVLLLTTGCAREPVALEYTETHIALYSVLAAGSPTASVLLTRFIPGTGSTERLRDAEVLLTHAQDTIRLEEGSGFSGCAPPGGAADEQPTQWGCYAGAIPGGIQAGERYGLLIRHPNVAIAHGTAVIPAPPQILAPAANSRVQVLNGGRRPHDPTGGSQGLRPVAEIPVAWTIPVSVARLELALAIDTVFSAGTTTIEPYCRVEGPQNSDVSEQESIVLHVQEIRCSHANSEVRWDSLSARILVTGYDTAYARYATEILKAEAVRLGSAAAGIEGVLGVFGGAAIATRRIILVPADG